jgi:hypothetical protein
MFHTHIKELAIFSISSAFQEVDRVITVLILDNTLLPKDYHFDVVGGPSTLHDPESDAGGSLSSWQRHPSP